MYRRRTAVGACLLLVASVCAGFAQEQRHFIFTYAFTVKNPERGKPLRVWFPAAHSDKFQTVRLISVNGDLPARRTRDAEYGNEMFFAETRKADRDSYRFEAVYDVVRHERRGLRQASAREESRAALQRFLEPNRLVPITGRPAELAVEVVQGKTQTMEKARAIYDYVLANVRYDKSGQGWGRGDTMWVCDSKRGNCTDFHSLFMSMARSQKIPTRFQIGFPLPADKNAGEVAGYHCWSDFYVDGKGWIPVDISEAWKHSDKREYFFGAHDVNRIQFSVGRDLTLSPKQAGPPLNYFIYPYAEVDGREHINVDNRFSFEDVKGGRSQTASRF